MCDALLAMKEISLGGRQQYQPMNARYCVSCLRGAFFHTHAQGTDEDVLTSERVFYSSTKRQHTTELREEANVVVATSWLTKIIKQPQLGGS